MVGYSPFGSPDLPWGEKMPHILVDPVLKSIAEKHNRSTANVALRWLLQRGVSAIPKVRIDRLREVTAKSNGLAVAERHRIGASRQPQGVRV